MMAGHDGSAMNVLTSCERKLYWGVMAEPDRVREELLCRLAARGDTAAWSELVRQYHHRVKAFVSWRLGGNHPALDDLVQETWLLTVRKLHAFDPTLGPFASWVCGVASNVIRNHLRAKLHDRKRLIGVIGLVANHMPTEPESPSAQDHVAWVLAELDERYEAVLRAKYLDGMSVNQIAKDWRETPKAIESLLTRARAAFRQAFEKRQVKQISEQDGSR